MCWSKGRSTRTPAPANYAGVNGVGSFNTCPDHRCWVERPYSGDQRRLASMQTHLRGRDFISDLDFSKDEVETVLDEAFDLKRKRAGGEPHALLHDKGLAMLFVFSSTGTLGSC